MEGHGKKDVLCGCLSGNVSDQLFLFRDYRVNLSSKVRDSVLDDVPENLRVYLKIFMNKDVSEI